MTGDWIDYLKLLAALGVVLTLAWASARFAVPALFARRNTAGGLIRVRAACPLEPKKTIYLVQVGERTLCVGSTDNSLSLLATLEAGEMPPLPQPDAPRSFREFLERRK